MIPLLSNTQLASIAKNVEFQQRGHKCPVCLGDKKYFYKDVEYDCPDDDYGHPMLRLAKLYWLHNIPLQYQLLIWDEFPHKEDKSDLEQYLENFERLRMSGAGVTIWGEGLGVGKTWAVTHILKEAVKAGYDAWFVTFFDIMGYLEMEDRELRSYEMGRMRSAEILVIDDIQAPWGSEKQRHYFEEKMEEVVRRRTNMNFPTLVTTNMKLSDFDKTYPRVGSLLAAKNIAFHFQGKDARRGEAVSDSNQRLAMRGETRPIT